ncbi:MAG: hypothetical protein N2545_11860, partial [Thermoflexales bacterium]|nr:hypothetical protein [Thermoflexales bacterium]
NCCNMTPEPHFSDDEDWRPSRALPGSWEDGGDMQTRSANPLLVAWNDPRTRPLLLVSAAALLGILALGCFILALVLLDDRASDREPPVDVRATLTPVNTPAVLSDVVVIQANETPLPVAIPVRLTIGQQLFEVRAVNVDGDRWQYDREAEGVAYWLPGTVINYVFGLAPRDANRQALTALRAEDLLVLETTSGVQRYRVESIENLSEAELLARFSQQSPGLTLFLLEEGASRRTALIARYADEATPNQLTSVGVPINLGEIRVTVNAHRLVRGAEVGLPLGRNYYQVDFEVMSLLTGTQVLDAAQFFAELRDASGATYPLSRAASSAAGGRGFTQGALQAGQVLNATAGFEVPDTLAGPVLEWRFALNKNTPYVARVALPYRELVITPTPAPTPVPVAEVTLLNANISPDGTELRVVGLVRNLTNAVLSGSLRDVSLRMPDGQFVPINSVLPAFPWEIAPGETLAFQINFVRPAGSGPAVFTLYNQSYEIGGF